MGAVYSLFPSGYVAPTKTTTVDEIVNLPIAEQAAFASQSVIMRADDCEFAKQLLEMAAPEPVTSEYLATLAAVIKTNNEHAAALREKYRAVAGKPLADEVAPADEQKDQVSAVSAADPTAELTAEPALAHTADPAPIFSQAEEKIIERFVSVHYCPSCGKVFRGSEEDDDDESSDISSTLSNSLD